MSVGDIMSTMGVFSTQGRYHEYIWGCSVNCMMFSTMEGYNEYIGRFWDE